MDPRATLARAESLHKAGDLAGAEAASRAVVDAEPTNANARYLLGAVCQPIGRIGEATDCPTYETPSSE